MAQLHEESDHEPSTGTPRWVKLSGIVVISLVLLFVALRLTGLGGEHGPNRHLSPAGGDTAPLEYRVSRA